MYIFSMYSDTCCCSKYSDVHVYMRICTHGHHMMVKDTYLRKMNFKTHIFYTYLLTILCSTVTFLYWQVLSGMIRIIVYKVLDHPSRLPHRGVTFLQQVYWLLNAQYSCYALIEL